MQLYKEIKIFDEWFTDIVKAIAHSRNDWVTAREMIPNFEALDLVFDDVLVKNLDTETRHQFLMRLIEILSFFGFAKLLRRKAKPHYSPHLRIIRLICV